MKRCFAFLLMLSLCFCVLSPYTVLAESETILTDERTGVKYTLTHKETEIQAAIHIAYESNDLTYNISEMRETDFNDKSIYYKDVLPVERTSPKIQEAFEEYEKRLDEVCTAISGREILSEWWLLNGNERKFKPEDSSFFRFFGVPYDFKGKKEVNKDGVLFAITGDGKGSLSVKVITNLKGYKFKTYKVPPTYKYEKYTIADQVTYKACYKDKDSKKNRYNTSSSLEEIFDNCVNFGDLSETVDIEVYSKFIQGYRVLESYTTLIKVQYGNYAGQGAPVVPMEQTKTTNSTKKVTKDSTSTTYKTTTSTDTQKTTITTSLTTATSTALKEEIGETSKTNREEQMDSQVTEQKNTRFFKTGVLWFVAGLLAIVIVCLSVMLLRKKNM